MSAGDKAGGGGCRGSCQLWGSQMLLQCHLQGSPWRGAQGPGAAEGLPYLPPHFLGIWEKQGECVAPNPTVGETLQTPGRGAHTAWAVHHLLGE